MTPEHPVLAVKGDKGSGKHRSHRRIRTFRYGVKPEWTRADELTKGDYVFFPKYREISDAEEVTCGGSRLSLNVELGYLLGWYVAEGSGSDSEGHGIAFSLSSKEIEHVAAVRELLKQFFDAKTSVYSNGNKSLARIVVTSSNFPNMPAIFKQWRGANAESKRIPDFILNPKPEVLKSFLRGLFEGDEDFIDIATISRNFAYQLVLAFSKLEMLAEIVGYPGSVRSGFSVRVRGSKLQSIFPDFPIHEKIDKFHYWETKDGFYYPIRKIWSEDYTGEVMDFQAPGYAMLSPFVTRDCVT